MQISLSKSDCQALLRQDLYAFTQRCFCELNPTTAFKAIGTSNALLDFGSLPAQRGDAA